MPAVRKIPFNINDAGERPSAVHASDRLCIPRNLASGSEVAAELTPLSSRTANGSVRTYSAVYWTAWGTFLKSCSSAAGIDAVSTLMNVSSSTAFGDVPGPEEQCEVDVSDVMQHDTMHATRTYEQQSACRSPGSVRRPLSPTKERWSHPIQNPG